MKRRTRNLLLMGLLGLSLAGQAGAGDMRDPSGYAPRQDMQPWRVAELSPEERDMLRRKWRDLPPERRDELRRKLRDQAPETRGQPDHYRREDGHARGDRPRGYGQGYEYRRDEESSGERRR